jgi:hypothetical protein
MTIGHWTIDNIASRKIRGRRHTGARDGGARVGVGDTTPHRANQQLPHSHTQIHALASPLTLSSMLIDIQSQLLMIQCPMIIECLPAYILVLAIIYTA